MTNPYGITLDREWAEWPAKIGVSPTVAAALLLICQARPLDEIVARLTPGELEQVVEIVGRCPDHFPPGTLDAAFICRRSARAGHRAGDRARPPQAGRSLKAMASNPGLVAALLSDAVLNWLINGGMIAHDQRGDARAILRSINAWLELHSRSLKRATTSPS